MQRKRVVLGMFFIIVVLSAVAGGSEKPEGISLSLFGDAGGADALIADHLYLKGGVGLQLNDRLMLDLPVLFLVNRTELPADEEYDLLDIGVMVKYYPGGGVFFGGISLFQGAGFVSREVEQNYHAMNEMTIGVTLDIPKGLFLEPTLTVRDPLGIFEDSLDYIQEYVPGYGDYRIGLHIGWKSEPIE